MKHYHSLRTTKEFQQVYKTGKSKANRYLVLYCRENQLNYNRFGISVSKKVGNSVVRHRVTRLLRESYRLRESEFKQGFDLVVIARNTVKDEGFHTVESALFHLMKLHRLKRDEKH